MAARALRIDDRIARNRREADRLDDLHPTPVKAQLVSSSFESPESSTILSAQYDKKTSTLTVVFRHGKRYSYPNVPLETWVEFLAAESKGTFFSRAIRPVHEGTLVKLAPVKA